MTLENVTAPVADAHGNKVNHPHTLIMSKAKIVNVISTESKISTKTRPTHKEARGGRGRNKRGAHIVTLFFDI